MRFLVLGAQVNHDVVVDTSSDPAVYITSVYTTLEDGTYGVGHEIPVTVMFSAPVGLCLCLHVAFVLCVALSYVLIFLTVLLLRQRCARRGD